MSSAWNKVQSHSELITMLISTVSLVIDLPDMWTLLFLSITAQLLSTQRQTLPALGLHIKSLLDDQRDDDF